MIYLLCFAAGFIFLPLFEFITGEYFMNKVLAAKKDKLAPDFSYIGGSHGRQAESAWRGGYDTGVSASKEYYDEILIVLVRALDSLKTNEKFLPDCACSRTADMALAKYEKWKANEA